MGELLLESEGQALKMEILRWDKEALGRGRPRDEMGALLQNCSSSSSSLKGDKPQAQFCMPTPTQLAESCGFADLALG